MTLLQNVLAITYKDMKQMRKLLLFGNGLLLVYGVLLAFLNEVDKGLILVAMIMVISVVGFATRSAMVEEQRWRFLYSLPLTKSHIALGKYAAILAATLLYLISATLGLVIQAFMVGSTTGLAISIWVLAGLAGTGLLFAGSALAVALRWGVRAAMYLQYVPLVLFVFGGIPAFKQLAHRIGEVVLTTWQAVNPSPAAVTTVVVIAILAIYLLQADIAARLLESREV